MRTRKGFTIVELVIVIAVIAVLAAVLIPSFSGVVEKADKNTALKLAESAYKEARAAEIEKGGSFPRASDEVDGFIFVIHNNGTNDYVFKYPENFKYAVEIANKKVALGGKLAVHNPNGDQYANDTPATGVALHRDSITLEVGQTELLHAAVQPANAKPTVVEWEVTGNNGVIEFNNGQIKALAEGTVTITATVETAEGPKTDYCTVTVERVKVNFVSLNALNMSFTLGDVGRQLTATVKPSAVTAPYDTVRWSSANERIATVDENTGFVTPKGPGYTEVTATVDGKTAKCGVTVNGLVFDVASQNIEKGKSFRIPYIAYPVGDIDWTAVDGTVAIVNDGVVTAKGVGETIIRAITSSGAVAECAIVVTGDSDIAVPSIALGRTKVGIIKNQTIDLDAKLTNIPAGNVDWSSGDTEIATVNTNGVVTAVKAGRTTITAKIVVDSTEYTATCEVTVTDSAGSTITGITLDKTFVLMTAGESTELLESITPREATGYDIVWTSTNDETVSVVGRAITAKQPGTAVITAGVKVGDNIVVFDSCTVVVKPKIYDVNVMANAGQVSFIGELTVVGGNNYEAEIDSVHGYEIYAVDIRIGGETVENAYEATTGKISIAAEKIVSAVDIRIVTIPVEEIKVPVTSVELSYDSVDLIAGDSMTLGLEINPNNATDKSVTWTSSNTGVASVNSSGVVAAHNNGEATITVTTSNGLTASCKVTVIGGGAAVTGVILDNDALSLAVGESGQLTATVNPSDAGNKNIIWGSLNSAVATVDSTGKVTAKAAGTAIITVTTIEGNFSAMCTVTVTVTDPQPPADPEPTELHSVSVSGGNVAILVNGEDITKKSCTIGDGETLLARVQPAEGFVITGVRIERNATEVTDGYAINYAGGDIEIRNVTCPINITVETAPNMATSAKAIDNVINADLDISSIADTGDNNTVYIWSKKNTIDQIKWTITKGEGTETEIGAFEDIKSSSYSFIVDADKIQGLTGLYLTIHCTGGDNVGSISKDDFVITYKPPMGLFNE